MKSEYEIIEHSIFEYFNLFLVTITQRNAHLHSDFELNYILSGKVTLITHKGEYRFSTGALILINPNVSHELQADGESAVILCLQTSPEYLRKKIPGIGYIFFDEMVLQNTLSREKIVDICILFIEAAYQSVLREPMWQMLCGSMLTSIVYLLLRHIPFHTLSDHERDSTRRRVERLGRIVDYVEGNYMRKAILADIAAKENVTAGYLSHFVKDNLNCTFQDYVGSVRLRHAKELLCTGKRIIDICLETGFSDPRYLRRTLMKHEGCSIEQYRNRSECSSEKLRQNRADIEALLEPESAVEILEKRRFILQGRVENSRN